MARPSRSCRPPQRRTAQQGFGYLLLLFAVAALGVSLAGIGQSARLATQRAREAELVAIGREFADALASYRARTPDGMPSAPATLDELVEDHRFPFRVRHLRRIYRDPVSGVTEWGLVVAGGRIVGVHSLSTNKPLRPNAPPGVSLGGQGGAVDEGAATPETVYADWVFVASAAEGKQAATAAGPANGSPTAAPPGPAITLPD